MLRAEGGHTDALHTLGYYKIFTVITRKRAVTDIFYGRRQLHPCTAILKRLTAYCDGAALYLAILYILPRINERAANVQRTALTAALVMVKCRIGKRTLTNVRWRAGRLDDDAGLHQPGGEDAHGVRRLALPHGTRASV